MKQKKREKRRNRILTVMMILILTLCNLMPFSVLAAPVWKKPGKISTGQEETEAGTGEEADKSAAEAAAEEAGSEEAAVEPDNLEQQGYDVVFCIDNSGSMWNQQAARDQALRSISKLAVGADIRIGGVYFGNKIYKKLGLTSMEDKEGSMQVMEEFLNLTEKDEKNRNTNIGVALEEALSLFENQDSSRKRILILFSDGINENLEESAQYKKAADEKTEKQAQLLYEKGIPVYCVYLQKERNDEEYLKELVNYFDSGNSYEKERFKKVTESQIDQLSQQFAKIFYSMQNNMKYKEIQIDDTGKTSFYIPTLGVQKLQLYLNNDSSYDVVLNGPEGAEEPEFFLKDGSNTYITIHNPKAGNWTLEVSGRNKTRTSGTIACYAHLLAGAELISENPEDEGKVFKNEKQRLRLHFFNEEGKEVPADPGAEVSAEVILTKEDGEDVIQNISLKNTDSGYESEAFQFEEYGGYRFQVEMVYEDFIDFFYRIQGGVVEGRAPITYDKTNERFSASGSEDGERFTLKLSELYEDPDREEAEVTGVTQLNEENPVQVKTEGDLIIVTAAERGNVKFALSLEDTSGKTADVTIEGKVQDRVWMQMIVTVCAAILLLFVLIVLLWWRRRKWLQKKLQEEGERFEQVRESACAVYEQHLKKREEIKKAETELNNAVTTLRELCEDFPKELQGDYQNYLQSDFIENSLRDIRAISEKAERKRTALKGSEMIVVRTMNKRKGKKALSVVKEEIRNAEAAEKYFEECTEQYPERLKELRAEAEKVSQAVCDLGILVEEPVRCSLKLHYKEYIGSRVCKKGKRNLQGGYSLDEVQMLWQGGDCVLKDALCGKSTGIYVFGYENDEGNAGLKLLAAKDFRIRNAAAGRERSVKEAELLCGERYRIIPESMEVITVEVE